MSLLGWFFTSAAIACVLYVNAILHRVPKTRQKIRELLQRTGGCTVGELQTEFGDKPEFYIGLGDMVANAEVSGDGPPGRRIYTLTFKGSMALLREGGTR